MPSTLTEEKLEDMEACGLLPEKAISGWKGCYGLEFPSEDRTETIVFRSFYEKGFGLPAGTFFRGLLHYYGLAAIHLKPNSIHSSRSLSICVRGSWSFLPISTYGERCTT
jgi:hypothetical protein